MRIQFDRTGKLLTRYIHVRLSHRTPPKILDQTRGVVPFEVPQYTKGYGREDEYKLENVFKFAAIESDHRAHDDDSETHGEAYVVALHDDKPNEYEQIERQRGVCSHLSRR